MKVGLLGGSFNPAHQGHIHISNLAFKNLKLNQVWWLPTKQNPFKEKENNYFARFENCKVFAKNNPKIYIKKYNDIRTVNLIAKLQAKYNNIEFFWIMGADNFENFHRWELFMKLIRMIKLVVFARENHFKRIKKTRAYLLIKSNEQSNLKIFNSKKLDISSTQIRKEFK